MKIINEQGKLFGAINMIDLLIIVCLIAIGIVLFRSKFMAAEPIGEVSSIIGKVSDVIPEIAAGLKVGDLIYNNKYSKKEHVGEIAEIISSRAAKKILINEKGEQILSESPINYDIYFKIHFVQPIKVWPMKMKFLNRPINIRIGTMLQVYNNKVDLDIQIIKQIMAKK